MPSSVIAVAAPPVPDFLNIGMQAEATTLRAGTPSAAATSTEKRHETSSTRPAPDGSPRLCTEAYGIRPSVGDPDTTPATRKGKRTTVREMRTPRFGNSRSRKA